MHDKKPASGYRGKISGKINQPVGPKHVIKRRTGSVCQVAATHRRAYTSRVFHRHYHFDFIFRFYHRVFESHDNVPNPYAVLFRSFVCQIFIERFGVAVNERETSSTIVRNRKKERRGKERQKKRERASTKPITKVRPRLVSERAKKKR